MTLLGVKYFFKARHFEKHPFYLLVTLYDGISPPSLVFFTNEKIYPKNFVGDEHRQRPGPLLEFPGLVVF